MDAAKLEAHRYELADRLACPSNHDGQRANDRANILIDAEVDFYRVASIAIDSLYSHARATAFCFQLSQKITESENLELNFYRQFALGTWVLHQMVLMELCRLEYSSLELFKCLVILLPNDEVQIRNEPSTSEFPFPPWTSEEDKYGNHLTTRESYPTPEWMFTGAAPTQGEERLWHFNVERDFLTPEWQRHSITSPWLMKKPKEYQDSGGTVKWIQAINKIESNEYRINKDLLVLIHYLDEKLPDGLVFKEPAKNPSRGSKACKRKSKRRLFDSLLKRADELVQLESFYQRCFVDYRGRVYLNRSLLNFQGDDAARSLIEFSQGVELNKEGFDSLLLHAANLYGCKDSPAERIKLGREKLAAWVAYANDSRGTYKQWMVDDDGDPLDDPLQFIRACMELRNATTPSRLTRKKGFVTHLPVEVDQSNSVIQHLAAMRRHDWSKDSALALANKSNLTRRGDFYTELAKRIQIRKGLTEKQTRKLIKTMVVSKTYGSGPDPIAEQWRELGIPSISKLSKTRRKALAVAAIRALEVEVPELRAFYRDIHGLFDTLHRQQPFVGTDRRGNPIRAVPPVRWSLPNGFVMQLTPHLTCKSTQRVAHSKAQHEKSGWHGYAKLTARRYLERLNIVVIKKSLMTSVIHSLDATVAHKICADAPFPIIAVHDAWACHANNIPKLRKLFVDTFTYVHEAELPWFQIQNDMLGTPIPTGRGETGIGIADFDPEFTEEIRDFYATIEDFPDSIS